MRRSSRPRMRQLGATIATTQSAEIEKMKGWFDRWYSSPSLFMLENTVHPQVSGVRR
ncbi:DUF305 domain-containing protein [Nonomuraea sp. NPDC003709]|uniref:DUF305 domain-containing protein n=1 Tax=Nonomuraea sp. NPDC003709 TaxID=3154450 RepID=UPI0033B6964B